MYLGFGQNRLIALLMHSSNLIYVLFLEKRKQTNRRPWVKNERKSRNSKEGQENSVICQHVTHSPANGWGVGWHVQARVTSIGDKSSKSKPIIRSACAELTQGSHAICVPSRYGKGLSTRKSGRTWAFSSSPLCPFKSNPNFLPPCDSLSPSS